MKMIKTALTLGLLMASVAHAGQPTFSDKLLLTGGVTNIEGAAGGGLAPWAVIGSNGTKGQIGAAANYTRVNLTDYTLDSYGVLVGIDNRVELSLARQDFDLEGTGVAVRAGNGLDPTGTYKLQQDIFGVKVRVAGDAVLDQDTWMPQIAVGAMYKRAKNGFGPLPSLARFVGAQDNDGIDFYAAATKLFLKQSLLVNATVRATKGNQFGLVGFGGPGNDSYRPQFEGSVAYLLRKDLALGAEYRSKPNNLTTGPLGNAIRETDAYDIFLAYALSKRATATLAYVDVGKIVPGLTDNNSQRGSYLSIQLGF